MKKEEELKRNLDEKDKWYKEQLDVLQNRVRPQLRQINVLIHHRGLATDTLMSLIVHR